jgi:predicted nucleic acid-binding protein
LIAYSDTSAIVPLLIDEGSTDRCREHWLGANRLVTVRLVQVEARASFARAARERRITSSQLNAAAQALPSLLSQLDLIEVDAELIEHAASLAQTEALRAYDAVHLAGALVAAGDDLVMVAGDRPLIAAARTSGLATATID